MAKEKDGERERGLTDKMLEVQRKLGVVVKDSSNPYYKSKYADINKFIEVLKPILNEVGLVVVQPLATHKKSMTTGIETRVIDPDTDDFMTSFVKIPENTDAQKMGSTITYFRRYALQSLFFMQAEDDDANVASGKEIKETDLPF